MVKMLLNLLRRQTLTLKRLSLASLGFSIIFLALSYNNLKKTVMTSKKVNYELQQDILQKSVSVKDDEFMKRMKQRMDERRGKLKENCKKLGIHHNSMETRDYLVYSDKYKAIFCQIPKTGITNWKYIFASLEGLTFQKVLAGKFRLNHQIMGTEKNRRLHNPDWFKMTVVREPLERIVSAYRSKIEPRKSRIKNFLSKHTGRKDLTFSMFVNFLVEENLNPLVKSNDHWAKYTELCQPCDLDYEVIGHQETMDEDSKYVLRLIGAPENISLKSAYRNKTDDDLVYRYYSTVEPREKVFQLYDMLLEDYTLFGYPRPSVLDRLSKEQ